MLSALVLVALAALCAATFQPLGAPFLSPVATAPGFTAQVIFSNLTAPRGIAFDDNDNLLVVERGFGVTAFTKTTQGGTSGWERTVVINDPGFTHAIEVDGSSLFVSTASEVRLYNYDSTTKTVSGSTIIVNGLPADGGEFITLLLNPRLISKVRIDYACFAGVQIPDLCDPLSHSLVCGHGSSHQHRFDGSRSSFRSVPSSRLQIACSDPGCPSDMDLWGTHCIRNQKSRRLRHPRSTAFRGQRAAWLVYCGKRRVNRRRAWIHTEVCKRQPRRRT